MSRFYCLPEEVAENKIIIGQKDEIHHIVDVMRQQPGDSVVVFDGTGRQYSGDIYEVSNRKIVINIASSVMLQESQVKLCLACAIPKKSKFDYLIQKVTELGVDEIVPMITERTIVRPDKKNASVKLKRWQKICIEAAKQSGRVKLPRVNEIFSFKQIISLIRDYDLAVIAHLSEDRKDIRDLDLVDKKSVIILIGPEGDFSPTEIKLAKDSGGVPIALGRNVLKVDTAAIFAVGIFTNLLKKI